MKSNAYTHSVLLLAGALLLSSCAAVNDATMRVLATPSPAWAVVGERLLTGQALIYTDRSGTLELQAASDPALNCMGTLRYTSTSNGTVNLRCNDGTQAQLPFTALGEAIGYGGAAGGPISFAYGLEPESARAWLTPPAGKRLVVSGKSLRLE